MKYSFSVEMMISMSIDVEAKSIEEAIKKAESAPVMSLCHQCARGDDGEWRTSGELDGDPSSSRMVHACEGHSVDVLHIVEKLGLWDGGV